MPTLSRVLSIAVVTLAVIAISSIVYSQFLVSNDSYNSAISVSFQKSPAAYDYSCGEPDYQIYFTIRNTGPKTVTGLAITVSIPLCVGAIPGLPSALNASSSISFYVQSAAQNGTLTLSGNNTYLIVKF